LGSENRIESLDRFDFDGNKVFDKQVQTIFSKPSAFGYHWHHELPPQFPTGIVQLNAEGFFIGSFQKARSKLAMGFDGTTDDALPFSRSQCLCGQPYLNSDTKTLAS